MIPRFRRCRHVAFALLLCATPPVLAAQGKPAVLWQSLLSTTPVLGNANPSLRVPFIDVAFTPEEVGMASFVVRRGTTVETTVELRPNQRVGNVQRFEARRPFAQLQPEAGERIVEVRIGDVVVGAMTITVGKVADSDPFGTSGGWTVSGPWIDHAYFFRPVDETRQQRVHVSFWESSTEFTGSTRAKVSLAVKRGARVMATAPEWEVQGPVWVRKQRELRKPDGNVLLVSDLVAAGSGPVTVELQRDGTTYRQWQARVENGWFVPHALSATPPADATHFLSPRDLAEDGGGMGALLFAWMMR